ncbi:eukaryotic translation initiation factor 2 gamma subunit (eif-2-gamma) [Bimuria novae-zelandiae CBS 107.79]|uniref:protein-synthesizing GTPase n=1 Tax=Bimuria novae-zelandiae CBS 107.79 TaxID=1447943 RepID=A0A6A5ULE4_9PLEO|nr:eukaryotic translation initiation factor 2 gamma subunit (eif-2-gamma) [Bimuria novae-zelandiae CBS 107.79]
MSASRSTSTPEEVERGPPTLNIGVIGHVAHGKSTLVRAIICVKTMQHKAELVCNITIKLGYANGKIYRCEDGSCGRMARHRSTGTGPGTAPQQCNGNLALIRRISFVDCPGHEVLMRTMLSGSSIFDAAILLVSANESCPQPQTVEHLAALSATNLKASSILVLQNKVDLVGAEAAAKHADAVRRFLHGTVAEGAPIIPLSAQFGINVDTVLEHIARVPAPAHNLATAARMTIIRSFDINRPGSSIDDLRGGVAVGSLTQGVLHVNDNIEVRPGLVTHDRSSGTTTWIPLFSKVTTLSAESQKLTTQFRELCRGDRLVGHVLGQPSSLSPMYATLRFRCEKGGLTDPLNIGDSILLHVGSAAMKGTVKKVKGGEVIVALAGPVCAEIGEAVAISRLIKGHWRLAGSGKILGGKEAKMAD